MDIDKFVKLKTKAVTKNRLLSFSKDELKELRLDEAEYFVKTIERNILMKLPDEEIAFFDWLKEKDPQIWDDIWDEEENEYYVSLDLLPQFIGSNNGFPICDLIDQSNYWFVIDHIKPKGMEQMKEILEKFNKGQQIGNMELFLSEISQASIDIWHFSYKFGFSLKYVKAMIEEMVYKGWIVHLSDREDLIKYIEI